MFQPIYRFNQILRLNYLYVIKKKLIINHLIKYYNWTSIERSKYLTFWSNITIEQELIRLKSPRLLTFEPELIRLKSSLLLTSEPELKRFKSFLLSSFDMSHIGKRLPNLKNPKFKIKADSTRFKGWPKKTNKQTKCSLISWRIMNH